MTKRTHVSCPMTNFSTIRDILFVLENEHTLQTKTLAEFTKKSLTIINNALPIIQEIGLIITSPTRPRKISLSIDGKNMVYYLKANDIEKIKELSQKAIMRSNILKEANNILKDAPEITPFELGKLLNNRIDPLYPWKNRLTYVHVGRTCIDILLGFHQLEDKDGMRGKKTMPHHKRKLIPYITTERIYELLNKFNDKNKWEIDASEQTYNERIRILGYMTSLIDLGIAHYIDKRKSIVELTSDGIKLKNTINEKQRKNEFQIILLKNIHVPEIIRRIMELDREIGYGDAGEILQKYNDCNWSTLTIRGYGIKIINWLREADIIEANNEYGKYHLSQKFLEKYKELFTKEKKMIVTDTRSFTINVVHPQPEKIIGDIHRYCNYILHSEKNKWDDSIKEKILLNIDSLINIYKERGESSRSFEHMKDWINSGYELKNKKFIKNCIELLVDDIE
jgi:hypothetical protein